MSSSGASRLPQRCHLQNCRLAPLVLPEPSTGTCGVTHLVLASPGGLIQRLSFGVQECALLSTEFKVLLLP